MQVLYANEPVGNSSTEFNSVLFPQRQFTIIVASITASVLQVKKKRKESKPQEFDDTLRAALGNSRKKDFPFNRKRPLSCTSKFNHHMNLSWSVKSSHYHYNAFILLQNTESNISKSKISSIRVSTDNSVHFILFDLRNIKTHSFKTSQ